MRVMNNGDRPRGVGLIHRLSLGLIRYGFVVLPAAVIVGLPIGRMRYEERWLAFSEIFSVDRLDALAVLVIVPIASVVGGLCLLMVRAAPRFWMLWLFVVVTCAAAAVYLGLTMTLRIVF